MLHGACCDIYSLLKIETNPYTPGVVFLHSSQWPKLWEIDLRAHRMRAQGIWTPRTRPYAEIRVCGMGCP